MGKSDLRRFNLEREDEDDHAAQMKVCHDQCGPDPGAVSAERLREQEHRGQANEEPTERDKHDRGTGGEQKHEAVRRGIPSLD